jgi:hypothetical protein
MTQETKGTALLTEHDLMQKKKPQIQILFIKKFDRRSPRYHSGEQQSPEKRMFL